MRKSMTRKTKLELTLFAVSTVVALPVFGGLGLTVLGLIDW
jgi:hypothetical protein